VLIHVMNDRICQAKLHQHPKVQVIFCPLFF
jgi:hypothetical protein